MANAVSLAVEITSKFKDSGFRDAETRTGKFKAGLSTAAKASAAALGLLGVAAISSAKAAAEDQKAQALLANTLKNTGATDAQIASTEDWITATSRATAVADDELRPALATLVRATGDVTKSQDAMAVALDVAAATGKPLESVSAAMAKGYAGQTTALGKLVPGMDKAILASGDMEAIQKELARTTGGAAAAAANSAAGKWKNFQIQMGEFQESLGAVLLPLMAKLGGWLQKIAVWAQKNATAFQIIVGVVAAFAAAIVVLNAVVKIATVLQAAYNLVMLANPVVLIVLAIIAAIALLAVGLVLLWKKSETFRKIVIGTWDGIKAAALGAWRVIKTVWDKILGAGKAVFSWIKQNWAFLLAGLLLGPFGVAVVAIVKHWDRIKQSAQNLLGWLKDAFRAAWGVIRDIVANQVEGVRNTIGRIRDTVNAVTDFIRSQFSAAWSAVSAAATRALSPIRSIIDAIKSAIYSLISAVNSLISALGRIKVPSIKLPNIPGLGRSAASAPVTPFGRSTGYALAPAVPRGLVGASTGGGSVVNITVTGAIDPEATARQIRRILDSHNRRQGFQ